MAAGSRDDQIGLPPLGHSDHDVRCAAEAAFAVHRDAALSDRLGLALELRL
jgi:hypothetical protein